MTFHKHTRGNVTPFKLPKDYVYLLLKIFCCLTMKKGMATETIGFGATLFTCPTLWPHLSIVDTNEDCSTRETDPWVPAACVRRLPVLRHTCLPKFVFVSNASLSLSNSIE